MPTMSNQSQSQTQRTVGLLLFNEVEVLDFAGAFEVFSLAENECGEKLFNVVTIAQYPANIFARNGLQVVPDYAFGQHPNIDVLVISGGYGAEKIVIHNPEIINWVKTQTLQAELTLIVCTGAYLLAETGLLDGKTVTTHWLDIEPLNQRYPNLNVVADVRYVDSSEDNLNHDSLKIITSAGISAGIDASLYCVAKLTSKSVANKTAKRMEYDFYL